MDASLQICKIKGIPIRLHFTMLIFIPVMFLFFMMNSPPIGFNNVDMTTKYLLSASATFLLFLSIVLHELSHSFFALKYGTKIHNITLFIFGGVAMMEDIPKEPRKEMQIALAGPAMSMLIGAFFLVIYVFLKYLGVFSPVRLLAASMSTLNFMLSFFNLIPAFPMDGGRLLRAAFACRMRFVDATKKAALVGKIIAAVMFVVGLMPDPAALMRGEPAPPMSPFLSLIAILIFIAATEEENATRIFSALEHVKVGDVMRRGDQAFVSADMTVEDVLEKMASERHTEYVVVNTYGEPVGSVFFRELKEIQEKREHKISDFIKPIEVVSSEDIALDALKRMLREHKDIFAVVDDEGKLVGAVTKKDLIASSELIAGKMK